MKRKLMRMTGAGLACIPLLLAGCSEMNVKKYLPFGNDTVQERSRTPANAAEYQCAGGKRFYLRTLEGGAAMWLILPEREVRLDRIGASSRYSNGIAVLELNGNEATLTDGAAASLAGCKTGSGQ